MNKKFWVRTIRYYTITDVWITSLLPTKSSSDDDSGFRHSFGTEASLPLAQSTPAVYDDTTKLRLIVVTLWDCHIHTDAVKTLSWIFFMYFLLADGGSPRLVKNAKVDLAMKPLHPTSAVAIKYVDCISDEGKNLHNQCPEYDVKQSDGKFPVMLELWWMWITSSLPSPLGPISPGVVAPRRASGVG